RGRRLSFRWLAVALVIALLGAGGGYTYVQAKGLEGAVFADFHSAQAHLERGKALLKQANQKHDSKSIEQARGQFQAGIDDFRLGRQVADSSRLAAVTGGLPLAGGFVRPR